MGSGASGRYSGTHGARWLAGEGVPRSVADYGSTLRRALAERGAFGGAAGGGGAALPAPGSPAGWEAVREALRGLLAAAAAAIGGAVAAEIAGEAAEAERDEERRPGIYENCLAVTGEEFREGEVRVSRKTGKEETLAGHFGERGEDEVFDIDRCGDAVQERANALFDQLSVGFVIERSLNDGKGMYRMLEDGTAVTYRWETNTPDSPAVEVHSPGDPRVMDHKVHFRRGDSPYRKAGDGQ